MDTTTGTEGELSSKREIILAGIETIDWHNLQHAYGAADDVPGMLRDLLSEVDAQREAAWEGLYSSIWHQGTVYQASAYVVPFLLNMLSYEGPPGKAELLAYLACLAQGNSYLEVHARKDEQIHRWEEIIRQKGHDFYTTMQEELGWVQSANQAVAGGLEQYFELLDHPDFEVRCLALQILASLKGKAGVIIPTLQGLIEAAPNPEMIACTLRALHDLMGAGPEAQVFFAKVIDQFADQSAYQKALFCAAVALAERDQELTPTKAERIIFQALDELGQVRRHRQMSPEEREIGEKILTRYEFPWGVTSLQLGLRALAKLGIERGQISLSKALALMQDGEAARQTGEILLDVTFNQGQIQDKATAERWLEPGARMLVEYWQPQPQPKRNLGELTAGQHSVLQALLTHDPFWHDQHDLLKLYGIPDSRKDLKQFLNTRTQAGSTWQAC